MKLRNLMGAFLALAGVAFGGVASAGDIYEIRPCDSLGITIDPPGPNEYMQGGDTAYFKVRLARRTRTGKQFHLTYKGTGESIDEIIAKKDFKKLLELYLTNPVEIGIFVSGEFRTAQYVTENYLTDGDFTDFIFSYTAKPGDFALPIRLADTDRKIINNSQNEPSKAYYFNFRDPALGTAVWDIDDSGTGVVEVHPAEFLYGDPGYAVTPPDGDQVKDYNLTKCNFQIKSTDFAPNDPEDSPIWRVVYEGAGVSNAVSAKLIVTGVPQDSLHLNLWSEDETAFYVEGGQLTDIHFNGPDKPAEPRHVLTIDIVAGKSEYEFKLRGVTRGMVTNLVLSAFKDYSYYTYMLAPVRVNDYLVKQVAVCDPQPPSVSVKVGRSPVAATDGGHTNKVTEVLVEFSQPYDQDVEIEIKPAFTDPSGKADHDWYDYLRFSARENENVALQEKDVYTNFPKVVIKAGQTKPSSVNGEAIYNGAVYLYAIYGDKFSDAEAGCFKIGIDTENAAAKKPSSEGGIDGWTRTDPLIVIAEDPSLSSKKATLNPTVNTDCAFDLKVSDTWSALKSAEGYKLYYQNKDPGFDPTDNDWQEVKKDAVWKPDASGILKDADGKSPALTYPLAQTYVTWFYVEGPNGKTSGKEADNGFSVTVVASKANTVTAWVSADEQATWVKTGRFDEGTDFYVTVELEKPIPSGETVYAFLAPVGEAVNFVSGDAVTNSEYTSGVEIPGGETAKEAMVVSMFKLTDGTLKGQQLKFDVILCKTQQFDPLQKVDGCQSVTLTLYARNIAPAFKQVTMDKVAKVENPEETMHTGSGKTEKTALVPIGVKKTFEVKVNEPSSVDLRATGAAGADSTWTKKDFTIEYTIAEENGAYDSGELTGNPTSTNFTYTFTGSGTATVTLRMHDKDMDDWTDEFSFYVEVTAQASVVIDSPESIDETMTGYSLAPINLSLSDFGTASVTAKVSVACNETTEKDPKKLGFVRIGGAINSEPLVDEDGDEYYLVELVGGKARLFVDEADGTDVSNRKGFTITAEIVDTRTDPVTKKPWKDYYLSESRILYVANAAPALLDCTLGNTVEEGNTNATKVGIGEVISVEYRVEDIIADLTNGIKVQWWDTDNKNAAVTNVYSSTNLCMFSTKFKSSGPKTIRVTLTDKDSKPTYVGEWNFLVESTKTLVTIANGPGQGPSTLSARYAGAKGAGEGHVWSDASFAFADNFWINWNCNPSAMSANVFGWGYKTNAVDNGTLDSGTTYQHDIPLGSRTSVHGLGGNTTESGKSALDDCYKYAGAVDSFLYGWIYHASGTDGGSGGGSGSVGLTSTFQALAPERTERGAAGTSAPLPNADNNDKAGGTATVTYPTVYMEAVFAKEYLPSDNMGDINADGIPDLYLLVSDYEFGIVDPATGELTGNDLRDLNFTDGEDPEPYCLDYLPTTETAAYSHLIPGLPESWGGETGTGKPFIPRLKIRGFDETDSIAIATRGGISASALNDAPTKWAGVAGVKPDQIYTNPREDAASTLNYVEWLAWSEFKAAHPTATEKDWSPERPTNPTRKDTDGDGLTDGYEYYFWYMAHVGYIDEDGVHRYLTGRAYNPRNPGDGDFIDSETLANAFDPQNPTSYKLRDTDNDGLPDELEFLIGTNPIDFDTDGDGLPDGFEIMLGGTDPLLAETTKGVSDAMRNFDGDAMAFTSPFYEKTYMAPKPLKTDMLYTFALVDADGDTDGVQWYVGKTAPPLEDLQPLETCVTGTSFTVGEKTYVTRGKVPVVDGRLAADLDKAATWEVLTRASLTNSIPSLTNLTWIVEGEPDPESGEPTLTTNATDFVALMPTRIAAGTEVAGVKTATYATLRFAADVTGVNAAWVYGRSVTAITTGDSLANIGGFGMLAIGRYQDAKAGVQIAALPAEDENVAYLHHFVYQEFGFDPRTAWNANTPLAPRWGKTITTGEGETETVANNFTANYGYAGVSTRTREYTLYDEFLVMSFFLNNGKLTKADVTATQAMPWEKIWSKYTTNGQGPNEPNWEQDNDHYKGRTAETNSGENGADTDLDGVPDGWELYVMAGPKVEDKETKELKYNFAAPYNDGFFSAFGPFVGDAAKASTTDNSATGANEFAAGDGDGLTELQEYAGTDSCAYYCEPWGGNAAAFSATIVRPAEHAAWLNKFFPTDPWNKDTDGDGLGDSAEAGKFKYGKPVDDGKSTCIPGGGLNPCTVDTDRDGLPDGWEAQYAGKTVYAGEDAQRPKDKDGNEVADGNVLQGLCDGMDGTVFDAYTSPRINNAGENYTVSLNGVAQVVDRDYDKDGLENWQEYLTGAMRCWRYDDPVTVWDYVPDAAFFNPITGEFDLAAAMRHTGIKNQNEFWYRLLFDTKSKWYNPHFVTASTPSSQYFSRVTNGWDQVFSEAGTYYMFYDRRNGDQLANTWGKDYYDLPMAPRKYIGTSPIDADTDQDGMDDGYELFHGLNPLLGAAGVLKSSNGPCDIVFDAWYVDGAGSPVNALENLWLDKIPGNGKYDFIVHPWLNGLVDADPDGDDIRNQDEAIMPLVAPHSVWLHTDPTPLWMTDSSYGDSIVSRFFRLPSARSMVPVPDSIVFNGEEYSLVDCDGYMVLPLIGPVIAPFLPDYWQVTGEGAANWAYSFEENEGYDTDHDSGSDFEEKEGKFRSATDPQDADSPRRRQAMYFPGEKAALQSMPFVKEAYPRAAMGYPDDMSFLQYTVECWVRPEAADPTKVYTVLERTSFTDPSHVADERYVRRNFAILIRNGKWCTAFDTNGTLDDSLVEVIGKTDAKVGEWTHVAATYDANRLTLYVNGSEDGYVLSSLKPEYGSSAVVTYPAGSGSVNTNDLVVDGSLEALQGTAHAYWFDSEYTQHAFLIGASFAEADDGDHLDVTKQKGWNRYKDFFKGYVDEVRVWDGARSSGDIAADMKKRYTRDDALANRDDFYDQWVNGRVRYNKDGSGKDMDVIPELRFHWAFDSIPGAENAAAVAQAPHGFLEGDKPIYSRPKNYRIPWWSGIVGAYGSVYEGERNWVPWIPNTVTHLPRFDQTTLDSSYWSENYAGDEAGTYKFARTAEPVSKWTQYVRNETDKPLEFRTTGRRFWLTHNTGSNGVATLDRQFEFTSRHLNQTGDDLLPLGGAFAKYVDVMWDEQGASSMWEQTGVDSDGDGLPDWWQEYVNQNCREGVPEGTYITWDTPIWYEIGGVKVRITAGEAYQRDLAKGAYVDAKGEVHRESEAYKQTADLDADGMPDWWEELKGLHNGAPDPKHGHAWDDPDSDGLANYVEYAVSTNGFLGESVGLNPSEMFTDGVLYDYFRTNGLAGADRRYVGFAMTDHDLIEDSFETEAERKVYSTHLDPERNGWSKWSEARAIYNRATWRVVGTERKFKTVEFKYNSAEENYFYATNQNFIALTEYHYTDKYTWGTDDDGDGWGPYVGGGDDAYDLVRITIAVEEPVYEYGGHPTPRVHVTLWGDLEKKYYESTEVENAGTTNEVTNVVMRAHSMYVEAYRGTDFSEAYWYGYIDGREENGKLVAEIDGEGLEEGLNTFVVRNGDTVGFATANVGYDRVDLEIGLEAESAVIPSGIWGSSSGRTAIRRVAINDEECAMRPVWMGQVDGYVTAAQVLANFRNGAIDLDSKYLVEDAAEMGIAADEIRTATYELVETYEYDGEMHSYAWETFDKTFSAARPRATLVTPTAEAAYRVRTRKPTFAFTGLDGCTAFVLEIATDRDDGAVILAATNILPVAWTSAGKSVREFRSDFQIGDGLDLADKSNYFWRVCGLNAKWPTAGDWSDWASFATAVDSTDGATGYGRLAAEVRYYGAATNDASDVIVGVFADAAFAGKPVATARLKAGDFADLAIAKQDFFKFSPEAPGAVAFDGLEPGDYYVMAFNDRNGNGRRDAWESWGYLNKVGQQVDDRFTPVALKVGPTWGKTVVSGVLFLEDTDVNDNGVPDCIEDELEVRPAAAVDADRDGLDTSDEHWNEYLWGADPEKWDTDGDGLPDGYEVWAGLDPIDAWEGKETYEYTGSNGVARTYTYSTPTAEYAVAGDVMAYAEVDRVMVTFADKTSALVMKGVKRPTVGDTAASCGDGTYEAVYAYGEGIGLGLPFRVVDTGLRITKVEDVKVVLVHSQVYDEFGYDMKTANAWAFAAGNAVNTKAFTAPDKYLLVRYFEALGLCSEDDVNVNRKWDGFALKPGEIDSNRDGIADGWNLYVMFGPDGTVATCTPWTSAAAARTVTSDGDITWVQEYDGGHYPTDPWNRYTLGDYFRSGEGKDEAISDKDAYAYHLKHFDGAEGDKYADFDNDGLCNYDEYDIMKNNNRTLDADNMFSYFGSVTVPALAGQCVPDYFLKSTRSNPKIYEQFETNVYDYLGFDYTSHDFIESWWKDQYQALMPNGGKCVDRTRFEPYADPDADGWDNWSERHGGTDPTREAVLSLVRSDKSEDHVVMAYPTPTIYTTVNYDSGDLLTAPIIVNAWQGGRTLEKPDAIWTVPGSGELSEWNTRFLGLAPNVVMNFNIGPGDVAQSHVMLEFYDPNYTIENWQILTNGTRKSLPTDLHMIDTSAWGVFYYGDNPTDKTFGPDTGTIAYYATGAGDENTSAQFGKALQGSYVNYKNGDIRIDFTADVFRQTDATFTIVEDGSGDDVEATYHRYHYDLTRSFWRIRWMGRLTATGNIRQFSLSKPAEFSDASRGHLREGPNTFVAYADVNGNSAYDPGEPFGCVKDVNVGFERVVDLDINLKKTSPVIPRFNPMDIGEGAGTNDAVTIEYKGKPVVSDLVDYQTVRIVRWEINGDECTHRTVFRKTAEQLGVITEADVLSDYSFDLDWAYLERDAAKAGIGFEDIRTVTYAVIVDVGALSPVEEEYVTGWIVKDFSGIRGKATPVAPSKGETAIVTAARPTFEFKAPSGYPAFAFELCDKDGNVVFSSTNHIGAKNAAGNVTYRPPVYFGWDEEADTTNRLLPNGEYTWRVALLSAKYRTAPRGGDAASTVWSAPAAFTVELAKGKVEDTDKGALDVVVRYYGDATVDAEHPIIVQAFRTADFTGIPEGQTAITNADLLDSYDDIKTVNAKIYGLAAGDYYICAFIDTTNDVKRMRWESWGYVNNVGTDKADLYTPVATKVMRNDTTAAVLFIEDMDCNNDRIPDWMDPTDIPWDWPWPEPPAYEEPPVPVTPEEPLDPNDPGGPIPQWFPEVEADPNDVMACEDLENVLLVKVGLSDSDTAARWYAVMDLSNEGWKLRDSDIALQTPAKDIESLVSTWKMGRFTGIGTNVTFTGEEKVLATKFEDIRLIHAQVYAKNGYETGCAAICPNEGNDPRLVDGIAAAEHPHTKPFTRADKYYFCRYLENIGVAGVSEAKMIAEVEAALKGVDPADYETVARPIWSKYTLDPDEIDMDRDDVADSWEAYAMFGTTGLKAFTEGKGIVALADLKVSPFNTADGMLVAPGADSQLKLVEEFDGGYYPTDPWSTDTDDDSVIDSYAYQYHLKGNDAGKDFDLDEKGEWTGDGLSNYAEYLISEVFGYAKLDPEKKFTSDGVQDYFRKVGDLYLGEIFTDHDQVGDSWEGSYDAFANRYVYDPDRDDDKDGWSNYAEFRAGTDPTTGDAYGVDEYTRAEYPVPVIEAKVVYNGNDVNLGQVVFKAWNEADDAGMLSAPDAVWTIGNGEASEQKTEEAGASGSTLEDYRKYVGRKPSGVQRYALGGGTLADGTIEISFLSKNFTDISYPTNETGKASAKPTTKPGDPKAAKWYLAARDNGAGEVVTLTGERIGTVDYKRGILEIDFDSEAICGPTAGDRTTGYAYATEYTATAGNTGYDAFSFDDAHVLVAWQAKLVGFSADGIYTLGDPDPVSGTAKSFGHVREGLTTFMCFSDENADGLYTAGEPFGVVRGVDVGWQGAKFTVELTEAHPVFARVNLYDGTSDRLTYWGAESGDVDAAILTNFWQDAVYGNALNAYEHIRIVPYAIAGTLTDTAYYDDAREYVQLASLVPNRVAEEFDVNVNTKPFISEADFIRDGQFDLDWDAFGPNGVYRYDEEDFVTHKKKVVEAVGDITAIKYRIVFGKEGPVGRDSDLADEISPVRAFTTLIERRFEPTKARTLPTDLWIGDIVYGARPTFRWRLDEPNTVDGYASSSALFGCTYTAFQIQIRNRDTDELVYDSGLVRTPPKNAKGEFEWTAPLFAGDQTDLGKVFGKSGNWKWRVAMYNAKFKPGTVEKYNGWSKEWDEFSTSVDTQQETDDRNFSSVDVSVKYAGPVEVLKACADLSETKGKVRIQAFTTADFSGEPVAQGFVTNKLLLTDTANVLANGRLVGLGFGTYYIRAYIDSNGNFRKDDWESWGYAKDAVVVKAGQLAPIAGIYIEDADTDRDWLPDAWEYVKYGDLEEEGAKVDPQGRIVLKKTVYDGLLAAATKANFSRDRSGATLAFFNNIGNATLLLGLEDADVTLAGIADIRAAVEKKIEEGSVKITSLVVDATNGKVYLTVDAKATDSIAGYLLSPVYEIPTSTDVTIKIYKKENLATDAWQLEKTVNKTIESTMSEQVEVDTGVDFNSGFFKVEVVK